MCRQFSCLPESGGYLDQDVQLMERAVVCDQVYLLVKKWRGMKTKTYQALTPMERELYKQLHDAKVDF